MIEEEAQVSPGRERERERGLAWVYLLLEI